MATRIADLGWRVRLDRFWKRFVETGRAEDHADPDARADLPAAAVSVSFELPAGASRRVPFALAWCFPHRVAWGGGVPRGRTFRGAFDPALDVGNHYAARFPTAESAAETLFGRLPALESGTVGFVRGVLALPAPDVVKEAALFNLSTLRTETCFRTSDGRFFGWEGVFDGEGSCYGNCTHVWGYEHALVDLWPDLAQGMVETWLAYALDDDGRPVAGHPQGL